MEGLSRLLGLAPDNASTDGETGSFTAPRIAAADALKAALAKGGAQTTRTQAKGISLLGPVAEFNVDDFPASTVQQLQVMTVTNIKSDFRTKIVNSIAANSTYICYGLRQGHIRVLSKETATKALLKGHTHPVMDMQFGSGSNMLASCDEVGAVHVRAVTESDLQLHEEILVRREFGANDMATRRLAWHPQLETLLAVIDTNRIAFINVPPTEGVASFPEFSEPVTSLGPHTSGSLTCLSFSPRGDLLAAADDAGNCHVWLLPADMGTKPRFEPLAADADLVFKAYDTDGEYPASIYFLDSGVSGQDVLVTGDSGNRNIKLWKVRKVGHTPGDDGAAPASPSLSADCTYTLQLTSSQGPKGLFNHMAVQPSYDFIVLADTLKKTVYVLHASGLSSDTPTLDFLSAFKVAQPVLSLSTCAESDTVTDVNGQQVFRLYTVQTENVQEYTVYPSACYPASDADDEPARSGGVTDLPAVPAFTPVLAPTLNMNMAATAAGFSEPGSSASEVAVPTTEASVTQQPSEDVGAADVPESAAAMQAEAEEVPQVVADGGDEQQVQGVEHGEDQEEGVPAADAALAADEAEDVAAPDVEVQPPQEQEVVDIAEVAVVPDAEPEPEQAQVDVVDEVQPAAAAQAGEDADVPAAADPVVEAPALPVLPRIVPAVPQQLAEEPPRAPSPPLLPPHHVLHLLGNEAAPATPPAHMPLPVNEAALAHPPALPVLAPRHHPVAPPPPPALAAARVLAAHALQQDNLVEGAPATPDPGSISGTPVMSREGSIVGRISPGPDDLALPSSFLAHSVAALLQDTPVTKGSGAAGDAGEPSSSASQAPRESAAEPGTSSSHAAAATSGSSGDAGKHSTTTLHLPGLMGYPPPPGADSTGVGPGPAPPLPSAPPPLLPATLLQAANRPASRSESAAGTQPSWSSTAAQPSSSQVPAINSLPSGSLAHSLASSNSICSDVTGTAQQQAAQQTPPGLASLQPPGPQVSIGSLSRRTSGDHGPIGPPSATHAPIGSDKRRSSSTRLSLLGDNMGGAVQAASGDAGAPSTEGGVVQETAAQPSTSSATDDVQVSSTAGASRLASLLASAGLTEEGSMGSSGAAAAAATPDAAKKSKAKKTGSTKAAPTSTPGKDVALPPAPSVQLLRRSSGAQQPLEEDVAQAKAAAAAGVSPLIAVSKPGAKHAEMVGSSGAVSSLPALSAASAGDVQAVLAHALEKMSAQHKESLKQLKAEFKAELKASSKAQEAALKLLLDSQAAARAAESKKTTDDVVRQVSQAVAGLSKELSFRVQQDVTKTLPVQVAAALGPAIKANLGEALPAAAQSAVDKAVDRAMKASLPKLLQDALKDCFATSVVPSVERATQVMFGQMQSTLSSGLAPAAAAATEGSSNIRAATTELSQTSSLLQPLVASLSQLVQQLAAAPALTTAPAINGPSAVAVAAAKQRAAAPVAIAVPVPVAVPVAVAPTAPPAVPAAVPVSALESHVVPQAAALKPKDNTTILREHVASGRFEDAFVLALSNASSQEGLLEWLLSRTQPEALLSTSPCKLSQGVLLSLLSHLSAGLDTDVEHKLSWITEAANALDARHAQCRAHARTILEPLKRAIVALAQGGGATPALTAAARTCVHTINSVIHIMTDV